jgi:murein DD-endopeptidase MepM/ murein hydrolase activator NlpD
LHESKNEHCGTALPGRQVLTAVRRPFLPPRFVRGFVCLAGALLLGMVSLGDLWAPWEALVCRLSEQAVVGNMDQPVAVESTPEVQPEVSPRDLAEERVLESGETLAAVLAERGVSPRVVHESLFALRRVFDPAGLRAGQPLTLTLTETGDDVVLRGITFADGVDAVVRVLCAADGTWYAERTLVPLRREVRTVQGVIRSSLALDARQQGVPAVVLHKMIQLLSHQVDFQRDIHPGDRFEVVFQRECNEQTGEGRGGEVLYTALLRDGEPVRIYRFEGEKGQTGFYDHNGESIRRGLLRTPVDGARISSGFGMRMHPLDGYRKHHKGLDFGAASGTPVMAAGDGVVENAVYKWDYGNYVMIRHSGEHKTAYAHLSRFAKGLRPGARVHQGQVIGYVGATGKKCKGAHLHFEVHHRGQPVNPRKVQSFGVQKLAGQRLKKFVSHRDNLLKKLTRG